MPALPKRVWLGAFVAAAAALSTCAGPPSADVGDGGPDAPDTAPDVPEDSPDAPPTPDWVPVAGFPSDCVLERASDPATVISTHWEPCAEVAAGCEMLRFDRVPGTLDSVIHAGAGNGDARAMWLRTHTGLVPDVEHAFDAIVDAARRPRAGRAL
jgi:hypothetical protein